MMTSHSVSLPTQSVPTGPRETKILVIDDTPANLEVIVSFLETEGFTILVAKDGESGYQRARYAKPNLILLDVLMPGWDGFETCYRLKQDNITSKIPIIFMAALTGVESKTKGFEVGAVDYVTKPIHHQELLARIKLQLQLQELNETLEAKNVLLSETNRVLEQQVALRTTQLTQALQDSKNRELQSRSIFETVSDGLVVIDSESGRLLTANRKYCEMHDSSLDELLCLEPLEVIPPNHHDKFKDLLKAVKSNQEFICEVNCRNSNHSAQWLEIKAVPFLYEGKHSALAVIRDVTERKLVEVTIQNSAEQFRRIFDNVGDGLVVIDLDTGMLLTANPTYCEMHGYSYEEILTLHPLTLIPPCHHEKYRAFLSTVRAGQTFTCEANCKKPDGTPFWIEIKSVPFIFDERPTALSVIRDVTERQHMESMIRAGETQFRSFFENVSDGLVVIDLDTGMLLTANPAYCEMHGYTYREILSLNPLDLIPPNRHDKYSSFLASVKAGQNFTCEANCKKPDGTSFCIEIKSVPFQFDERQTALSMIRDVTDRKRMEQAIQDKNTRLERAMTELKRTQVQLVQSEKMSSLGQLVAGVAHEINNPVSFIHGNLSYVQNYAGDLLDLVQLYQRHYPKPVPEIATAIDSLDLEFLQDDLAKILKSMEVGTERISEIVKSLRNFSRMDEAERKVVDIHQGLDNTLMILHHRLADCADHPEIRVIQEYGDLPLVRCYPGKLNQVFMNLLTNAIDALEEKNGTKTYEEIAANPNEIRIRTSLIEVPHGYAEMRASNVSSAVVLGKWVEIAIADNGPGIAVASQQKIFEPFFTTKPVGKGTGMGLSISYQTIVEGHDGQFTFSSTEGMGTEFLIQIPVGYALEDE